MTEHSRLPDHPAAAPLEGRAVVLTGAGGGIGAATALSLARLGARLLLCDVDRERLHATAQTLAQARYEAATHAADITQWDDCAALVQACVSRFGRIDGLVNNAGLIHLAAPQDETDGREVRRMLEVNVLGTYQVGVHALRHMMAQGSGAVVNITSGSQVGLAAGAAYSASKGAVASMTYAWALDAKAHGVRVNAVAPIATTAMSQYTDRFFTVPGQPPRERPYYDPACNAPAIAYLLSDAASDVNGQVLRVNGRWLQLMSHPAIMSPAIERESWTTHDVGEAFDTAWRSRLAPLGMATMEPRFTGIEAPRAPTSRDPLAPE